jgi:hypothetical protein
MKGAEDATGDRFPAKRIRGTWFWKEAGFPDLLLTFKAGARSAFQDSGTMEND